MIYLILQLASNELQNYYKGYTNILSRHFSKISTKMTNIDFAMKMNIEYIKCKKDLCFSK